MPRSEEGLSSCNQMGRCLLGFLGAAGEQLEIDKHSFAWPTSFDLEPLEPS